MTIDSTDTRTTQDQVVDWTDLGREMWSFLTGREAAINYRFIDMAVEVPRDTGADAPRATWKLNGTLQVTTRRTTPRPVRSRLPDRWPSTCRVDADLEFSVDIPGSAHRHRLADRVGQVPRAAVSDPFLFAGRSDAGAIRGLADGLAAPGPDRHRGVARGTAGDAGRAAVRPGCSAPLTGSRHIRVERGAGLWSLLRGRSPGAQRRRSADRRARPAAHPVARSPRRCAGGGGMPVTTTHDPHRRRQPPADPRPSRRTRGPTSPSRCSRCAPTSPPSASDAELRHPACRARAGARRDTARRRGRVRPGRPAAARGPVRVNGALVGPRAAAHGVPRRSRRLDLSFYREEYADHGRPVWRPDRRRARPPATAARRRHSPARPRREGHRMTSPDPSWSREPPGSSADGSARRSPPPGTRFGP